MAFFVLTWVMLIGQLKTVSDRPCLMSRHCTEWFIWGMDCPAPKWITRCSLLMHDIRRRSENNSTLGRPRSENAKISWVWLFHAVIPFMVNCIMPPNFRPLYDFLHFIFLAQAYHGKFQSSVEQKFQLELVTKVPLILEVWPQCIECCIFKGGHCISYVIMHNRLTS